MEYHIIATLSLVLSGMCVGGSILPAGPLSGAAGGAVLFSTTLEPTTRPFISVGWSFRGRNFITYTVTGSDFVDEAYAARVTLDRTTGSLQLRDLVLCVYPGSEHLDMWVALRSSERYTSSE